VRCVLDTVIDELLTFRERCGFGKHVLLLELAALVISVIIVYTTPINVLILSIYCFAYPLLLFVLGLKRTALYTLASFAILASITILAAYLLGGYVDRALRFSLTALTTLSLGAVIFVTLKPEMFRESTHIYLMLIALNHVVEEVRSIMLSYKSRGESGFKLYARVALASIALALARAEMLTDSLRARGFEVE